MKRRYLLLSLISLAVALTACHSRKAVKSVQTIAPPPPSSATANQEPSLRGKDYKEVAELQTVHFEFDRSTILPSEADLLNVALFGQTAKQWREANPALKGNMRDFADLEQLLVLANIEGLNAEFIRLGLSQSANGFFMP